MTDIAALIPAAGFGRRMRGSDKLLQSIEGEPLLRRIARRALEAGLATIVTLPPGGSERRAALAGLPVVTVDVPDADLGMSASLRRGVAALPGDVSAVMIVPADMPEITRADLMRVAEAFREQAEPMLCQATAEDGAPGHPVLFPRDCFDALSALEGDAGARPVLRANRHRLCLVPLPARHALTDLDTPEDWEAWRAASTDKTKKTG